jgi:MraZ protein
MALENNQAVDNSENDSDDSELPALLLGTYTPRLDSKGRLALPSKFRSQLAGEFVIARGQERCLYLLPSREFRRLAVSIQRAHVSDKPTRDYLRVFLSGASEEKMDRQGRIVIPPMLREYAHLQRDVAVIGVGTRAEVWDAHAWNTYLAQQEDPYSQISDDVLPEADL